MRHAEPPAERMGHRVCQHQSHLVKANARNGRSQTHAAPRLKVAAVRIGPAQIFCDEPHRVQVQRVGEWVCVTGQICLQRMRERIDAGRSRHLRRHRKAQLRVEDRDCGAHQIVRDAVLEARFLVRHDEAAVHLAARAGRRRDQDRRQRRMRDGLSMEVIERTPAVRHQHGDARCRVKRAAAAESKHAVAAQLPRQRIAVIDHRIARIFRHVVVDRVPHVRAPVQNRCDLFHNAGAAQHFVGAEQQIPDAEPRQLLRQAPPRPGPEAQPCGQIKVKRILHFKTSQHSSRRLRRGGDGIPVVVNPIRARRAICRREKMPGGFRLVFFAGIFYNLT